ncbi:MAG: hypothetical protein AAGL11_12030, partial [Pseudomonadota bacterium]
MPISQNTANIDTVSQYSPRDYVQVQHPEWAKDAVIYQINTRQFTPENIHAKLFQTGEVRLCGFERSFWR